MSSLTILGLSGNVTSPSRTAALVRATVESLRGKTGARADIVELADAAPHLLCALTRSSVGPEGEAILRRIETADVLVVGSPVYRASYTGALKHVFDLVGFDTLAGKPVILAATGGSPMHGLVTEHQLRPLLAFFRTFSLPTTLYAVESDFTDHRLASDAIAARIERASAEAAGFLAGPALPSPAPRLAARA